MNKILFLFYKFKKLFFLTEKQKQFISHNYETYESRNVEGASDKIVLMELNETVTSTIA